MGGFNNVMSKIGAAAGGARAGMQGGPLRQRYGQQGQAQPQGGGILAAIQAHRAQNRMKQGAGAAGGAVAGPVGSMSPPPPTVPQGGVSPPPGPAQIGQDDMPPPPVQDALHHDMNTGEGLAPGWATRPPGAPPPPQFGGAAELGQPPGPPTLQGGAMPGSKPGGYGYDQEEDDLRRPALGRRYGMTA